MDNKSVKTDISTRILETRKQTEELKMKLQNLIDSGINSSLQFNKASDRSNLDKENFKDSENKVQIIRSFDTKLSQHINKPSSSKVISTVKQKENKAEQELKEESPKKVRSYDVKEAREYIKKQREKRLEQLKLQNNEKLKAELQKKKLQELHKKSMKLVTKNVQAKRERSKSRDRKDFIRPDQDTRTRNRSYSRERICSGETSPKLRKRDIKPSRSAERTTVTQTNNKGRRNTNLNVEKRNPNLLYPPLPDHMVKLQKEKKVNNECERQVAESPKKSSNIHNQTKVEKRIEKQDNSESSSKSYLSRDTNLKPINLFNESKSKSECEESIETSNINQASNVLDYKDSQNVTLKPPKQFNLKSSKEDLIDPVNPENVTKEKHSRKSKSKLAETAVGTDNLEKDTKETQTSNEQKIEFPVWLQEKPVAYPFNFINTVKRKLQDAVNYSKHSVDIGIQSSIIEPKTPENTNLMPKTPENIKTKEEIMEILQNSTKSSKKSNLRSFISHRCLNLDPKTIDHLELIPKESQKTETITKISTTESESDTSKNIPEISSESESSSLKQNISSGLNIEKLNDLKLIRHNIKSPTVHSGVDQVDSTIKTSKSHKMKSSDTIKTKSDIEKSNLLNISNEYTSDFQSGSDLSRSRDSIISYNSPSYNKQIIYSVSRSPECDKSTLTHTLRTRSPEIHSNYIPVSITLRHSKNSSETSTNKSKELEKKLKDTSEPIATRAVALTIPVSSLKLTNKVKSSRSKESVSSKINSAIVSGITENEASKESENNISKERGNKSLSSIPTETESQSSSKKTENSKKVLSRSSQELKNSEKYTSLYSELHSSSTGDALSNPDSNLQTINTQRGCNFSKSDKLTEVLPLKEPTLSLMTANEEVKGKYEKKEDRSKLMRNISLRSGKSVAPGDLSSTNEIHLKFEAEIHLLNDFNESLRQFSAVEKAFESLKSKNDSATTVNKILQNRDTQTSILTKSSTGTKVTENGNRTRSDVSTINYSRGSGINDESSSIHFDDTIDKSLESTGVEISNLNKSTSSMLKSSPDLSNFENLQSANYAKMTIRMFEQLIKDEDVRLGNLKTILKIREQALLDRTKGELAWLEIQKKHLRETGKLQEASIIKKKQRGILVNHQKEKHEMQRLKQMQKAASIERKIILREQRNLIKHQLSTDTMLSKMKVNTPRERRLSGPLKVIQSHSESIRSETSISKRSSSDKYSITSHTHSVVSKVSEISAEEIVSRDMPSDVDANLTSKLTSESSGGIPVTQMKKTLLMREAALQKRRKAAEELLQWHKKLLEEEKRITELESTANAIISHIPSTVTSSSNVAEKYKFRGKQLNQLWFNLTGCDEKKFAEGKVYPMSQIALERFCKSAREYSSKTKKLLKKVSDSECSEARTDDSVSENIPEQKDDSASIRILNSHKTSSIKNDSIHTATTNDYTSDFNIESIQDIVSNKAMDVVDHNLNELIHNFSRIEADISSLGIKSIKSNEDPELDDSQPSDRTGSDVEISVIETHRTSREEEKSDSQEKLNTSNRNLSIVEEINKSTRDTLSKSEEVLLRLNQAGDSNKSPPIEEIQEISEVVYDLEKPNFLKDKANNEISEIVKSATEEKHLTSEGKDKLNKSEEILENFSQTGSNLSSISSSKKSSLEEKQTEDSLSKVKEILERLSQAEEMISTESSNKNSSPVEKNVANETRGSLSKTEEILEKLSQTQHTVNTDISSNKKSSRIENKKAISETTDNLSKTEDILENLSLLGDKNTSSKKSSIEENKILLEEKISLSKSEDILNDLGFLVDKVTTSKKSSVEENQILSDEETNLNKSEDILQRLSLAECKKLSEENFSIAQENQVLELISSQADVHTEIDENGIENSAVEENYSFKDSASLNETEEPLIKLSQLEDKAASEVSYEKSTEPIESDNLNKTREVLLYNTSAAGLLISKGSKTKEVSEAATTDSKNLAKTASRISEKDVSVLPSEDFDKNLISKSTEAISESLKDTYIDEELSIDEGSKSEDLKEKQISKEIIEIKDDEYEEQPIIEIDKEQNSGKDFERQVSEEIIEIEGDEIQPIVSIDEEQKQASKFIEIKDDDETQSVVEVGKEQKSEKIGTKEYIVDDEIVKDVPQGIVELKDDLDGEANTANSEISGTSIKSSIEPVEESNKIEVTDGETQENISQQSAVVAPEESEVNKEERSSSQFETDLDSTISENKSSNKDLIQQTASEISTDIGENDKSPIASLSSDCAPLSKEEINSYEEKEQDSLSSTNSSSSLSGIVTKKEETSSATDRSKNSLSEEKSPKSGTVDVKKRVSEIMADTSQVSRGDKSPRLQDLYVTTYDLISPANSPELGSPIEEQKLVAAKSIFGTEAEEILRKQLAIEQEIKLITEQQQKEHIPYMYVREIPNKPPPPYTPPSSLPPVSIITIIPSIQEIEEITKYSAKILHKAYLSNGLDNISISENTLGLISKNITKECYKFVFDICKEITKEHYKQFEKEKCVSWLQLKKKPQLAVVKPLDIVGLERYLNRNLKELFGYEKPNRRENAIIKWSRKKRDHVDEILVMESQAEETQWTNYEKDELLVMNEVTNEIMNMLLKETDDVFSKILSKRTYLY